MRLECPHVASREEEQGDEVDGPLPDDSRERDPQQVPDSHEEQVEADDISGPCRRLVKLGGQQDHGDDKVAGVEGRKNGEEAHGQTGQVLLRSRPILQQREE